MKYFLFIWIAGIVACNTSTINTQSSELTSSDNISYLKSDQIKLSDPILSIDSVIFKKSAHLVLGFGLIDSELHYKIDNGDFQAYKLPLTISENTSVSFMAKKEGYQQSNISQIQFVQSTDLLKDATLTLNPLPHERYPGNGASSLKDFVKGSLNFRANKTWCGFQSQTVEIDLTFDSVKKIRKIIVSNLKDHGSWIFAPEKIKVLIDGQLIQEIKLEIPLHMSDPEMEFLKIPFQEMSTQKVKVIIENMDAIPDWHPGKGNKPWLFIDEIIVE